jgi:NADPH:quinone reductase-like Zn-dependent oxidoreductase
MHAVILTGHGGYDCLQFRDDVSVPQPGHDEVLVELRAAAVNNTDINLRSAWYSKQASVGASDAGWSGAAARLPLIQGADGCGVVVGIGRDTDSSLLGARVLIDPIVRHGVGDTQRIEYVGSDRDGCFAEYVVVPARNALAIQSHLSDAELASFPCSYLAAENMLARASVGHSDRVLITGASGGVGSAAVQLARRRGARVMAIAAREKANAIEALGAEHVLARDADLVKALGANSIDVVIDCVGGAQFSSMLEVLRPRGRYAVAGAIAGPVVSLDLRTLYLKDLSLLGCTIAAASTFRDLVGYIERDEIRPVVACRFPLRDIVAAQQAFVSKQHTGKIVLEI